MAPRLFWARLDRARLRQQNDLLSDSSATGF